MRLITRAFTLRIFALDSDHPQTCQYKNRTKKDTLKI